MNPAAFLSPLDYQLVSLAIAARLVLYHVRARDYFDPEESLLPELQRTAASIARLVPLFRLRDSAAPADAGNLDGWAIRRGDLRTALLKLGTTTR